MNESIKRQFKIVSAVILVVLTVVSIYHLIKKIKEKDLLPILQAMRTLDDGASDIVDLRGNGFKYLLHNDREGHSFFEQFLAEKGYQYVAKYGKSELYDHGDLEVVVKKYPIFNKYLLCEIYDQEIVSENE